MPGTGIDVSTADLVELAAQGDGHAWESLVRRYEPVVRSTARKVCPDEARAEDVVQNTWISLVEHLAAVRSPERLGAWLTVTARREAWRQAADARRTVPMESLSLFDDGEQGRSPVEEAVLDADTHQWLCRAVGCLPPGWRPLVGELMSSGSPTYKEISRHLGIPVGSIGPTRARCISQLRALAGPA